MPDQIWETIEKAPVITLFRHTNPDPDALGSQRGLKKALEYIFPDKTVLALGHMTKDGFEMDEADPETVAGSLAILLDTANAERIDGRELYETAADTIRLDHHVKTEDLARIDYVDEKASATGEIIAGLLEANGQNPGKEAAQDLYRALTADNQRFTTGNTRPESLEAGAWLLRQGADVVKDSLAANTLTMETWGYRNRIRERSLRISDLLFSVMETGDYLEFALKETDAREHVGALAPPKEITVWALFTRCQDGTFAASLRSRQLEVRDIAEQFGGGGHVCAAGIKGLSNDQVADVIRLLASRSRSEPAE